MLSAVRATPVLLGCFQALGGDHVVGVAIELTRQDAADDVECLLGRHPGKRQRFNLHEASFRRLEHSVFLRAIGRCGVIDEPIRTQTKAVATALGVLRELVRQR